MVPHPIWKFGSTDIGDGFLDVMCRIRSPPLGFWLKTRVFGLGYKGFRLRSGREWWIRLDAGFEFGVMEEGRLLCLVDRSGFYFLVAIHGDYGLDWLGWV